MILLPQPPKELGSQVCTIPGQMSSDRLSVRIPVPSLGLWPWWDSSLDQGDKFIVKDTEGMRQAQDLPGEPQQRGSQVSEQIT